MPRSPRSHAGSCALRVLRSAARRVVAALLLACLALATAESVASVAADQGDARTATAATDRIAAAGDASVIEAGPRAPAPDDDGGCQQCTCPCHGACPCALLRTALPTAASAVPTVATAAATARVLTRAGVAPRGPAREPALRPPIARSAA
jgi:hypothetical protein